MGPAADRGAGPISGPRTARLAERVRERVGVEPCSGADLHSALGDEVFRLWKACESDAGLDLRIVGRRYMRLDRSVEGFARLSPSILREFLTYTVVGLAGDPRIDDAARRLQARTRIISRNKWRMAERIVREAFDPLVSTGQVESGSFCALVAGDIVYEMSHDVVRRESSTDALVEGSDLDIVVLVDDDAREGTLRLLDEALYRRKWLYLRNPAFNEEVDYIAKTFSRLREQAAFDTFGHMVACKVFDEARWLYGDRQLHERGRRLLADTGVVDRLRSLEREAAVRRIARERHLLALPGDELPAEDQLVFYTNEERAEFEH